MIFSSYYACLNCCKKKKDDSIIEYTSMKDILFILDNSDILFDNDTSTIYKYGNDIYKQHNPEEKKNYLTIIDELKKINHPQLLTPIEIFHYNQCIIEKFLFISNGDLMDSIISNKIVNLELKETILKNLLKLIRDFHNYGFSHRDLKPENILIDMNNNLFLTDFGFTCKYNCCKSFNSGTLKYAPPEILKYKDLKISDWRKIDIWSLGIIIYTLFISKFPWSEPTKKCDFYKYYTKNNEKFSYFKKIFSNRFTNIDEKYAYILSKILVVSIDERWNINMIINYLDI